MTEADQLRQVLKDLLEERSIPAWMLTLVENKAWLLNVLKYSKCACFTWGSHPIETHTASCLTGQMLRQLGGEFELQRQVTIAHGHALQDPAYWKTCWTLAMNEVVQHLRQNEATAQYRSTFPERAVLELIRAHVVTEDPQDSNRIRLTGFLYRCHQPHCWATGPSPHRPNCPDHADERNIATNGPRGVPGVPGIPPARALRGAPSIPPAGATGPVCKRCFLFRFDCRCELPE